MGRRGEANRERGVKAIEEKRMSYTEINSKTLKGFNINNPGLGGTETALKHGKCILF